MAAEPAEEQDLWLFGYGSLIWRPPPKFDRRVPGFVTGFVRRFWQASQDHRGTPDAPGRVVTLLTRAHWETLTDVHTRAPDETWGVAYRIPARFVPEVREALDLREINGYTADMAAFHVPVNVAGESANGSEALQLPRTIDCLVYIGLPTNPQFVGPQDPDALARHIVRSRGPSGENKDYVYKLEEGLEVLAGDAGVGDMMEVDEHVTDLARRVRLAEQELVRQS